MSSTGETNMKKTILAALGLVAAASFAPAFAAGNVGVSIGINQPGVHGRVDIGNYPQPQLYSPQPVIIEQHPVAMQRQPIYLYVPLAHQRNWGMYCRRYAACGQPVYFVQENWVRERYMHEHPGWRGRGHDRDFREDRHEDRRGHGDRGRG
jgi:hypothetical protein